MNRIRLLGNFGGLGKPVPTSARRLKRVALVVGLVATWGCRDHADTDVEQGSNKHAEEHAHGDAPSGVELPKTLSVSPELVESGRIVLAKAIPTASASSRRVPGEVVSSTDGEAEVSVLTGGRIAALEVNVGDAVKESQTLAWVESPEVGAARADLVTANAELALEKGRFARQEILQKEEATSLAAVESARAALKAAEANRQAALLRLSALGASSGSGARYAVRAPIDGIVTRRSATLGSVVQVGSVLFSVIAPGRILVVARYPEGQKQIPERGTVVELVPRGSGSSTSCTATVETSTRVVDPHTRTVLVRLRPAEDCISLRPGSYVEVHSRGQSAGQEKVVHEQRASQASVVRVPEQAVVFIRDRNYVFVADETPGRFHARWVRAQFPNDGTAIVEEGLKVGEQVVERGTILLKGEMLQEVMGSGHAH